jgi:glutamine synthetase
MPAASFARGQELRICQAIPMQCVTGEYSYHPIFPDSDPDVRLVPDIATLAPVPWASVPRYLAVHDCVELSGELCPFAPRSVLKTVVARYHALRLRPVVAQIEFYLTAAVTDPTQPWPCLWAGAAGPGASRLSPNMLNDWPRWDEFHAALDVLGIAPTPGCMKWAPPNRATCCTATPCTWPTRPLCSRWRPRKWRSSTA